MVSTPRLVAAAPPNWIGVFLSPAVNVIAPVVASIEEVAPVPDEYAPYIGEHADHPGEGKGKGAVKRSSPQKDLFSDGLANEAT